MGEARNELSGSAVNAVQAGSISGGVHFHAVTAALPVPRQLPADVVHFHDREVCLGGLQKWLDTDYGTSPPPQVIVGIGGVGKTSLATHWGHQVRDRFPDGDLYLDLRGYHVDGAVDADEALESLLRAFEVPGDRIPVGRDARGALLRSLLFGRRVLVVLDNVATVSQVRPLLPGTATCRVLVTSRTRLTGLVTREGATVMPLDVMAPDRAVGLLAQVAGADRIGAEPAAAAEVAEACGFLPLALRIAAGRLVVRPGLTVAELAEELAEERLNAFSEDDDEFSGVRSVFSWSYRDLAEDTARLFRLLGLPAGPDLGVEAVAALAGRPVPETRRLLERLVDAHLVQEEPARRYRLHDLVGLYAAERAAEHDEESRQALARLNLWYCQALDHATHVFAPDFRRIDIDLPAADRPLPDLPDRAAALRWCEVEYANLIAAAGQADGALAWQLPVVLFGLFLTRRPLGDWVDTHELGIAAAHDRGAALAEAWLCTSIALAHRDLREYPVALARLEQGLAGWEAAGAEWGAAWALRDIGSLKHLTGDLDGAVRTLRGALAFHVEAGDRFGEATALRMLGTVLTDRGEQDEAMGALRSSLEIRREQGNIGGEALVLAQLSEVSTAMGRFDEAVAHAEAALALPLISQHVGSAARTHDALATALARLGRDAEADDHRRLAMARYAEMLDPRAEELRALLADRAERAG